MPISRVQTTVNRLKLKYPRLAVAIPGTFEMIHRALDGAYMGSSMLDYGALVPTSSLADADKLNHIFHHNPHDLGFAIAESILFIGLSLLANDNTKQHRWLRYANIAWPYLRNFCSGLKNGRHAAVNVGAIAQHFLGRGIYSICNPIGLGIGAVYALALIWYHYENRKRDKHTKANTDLLQQIQDNGWSELPDDQIIHRYSRKKSVAMYAAAACDGVLDGLYMFGCLYLIMQVSLFTVSFGWPLAIAIGLIGVFAVVSFSVKMYREREKQHALADSASKCELALAKNKMNEAIAAEEHAQSQLDTLDFRMRANLFFNSIFEPNETTQQDEQTMRQTLVEQHRQALNNKEAAIECYQQRAKLIEEKAAAKELPTTLIGKASWWLTRGFISGIKNADAALQSIGKFINSAVIMPVVLIIIGMGYGVYLAGQEIFKIARQVKAKSQATVSTARNRASLFFQRPRRERSEQADVSAVVQHSMA